MGKSTVPRKDKQVPLGAFLYSVSGGGLPQLTAKEASVLARIKQFDTDADILKFENISDRRLRYIKESLRKKGYLSHYSSTIPQVGTTPSTAGTPTSQGQQNERYRAHGFTLSLTVYSPDEKYARQVQRRNAKELDGNGVVLYPKGIVIHGQEGLSFYGATPNEAFWNAYRYWSNFITRLENKYGVVLRKAGGDEFQIACEMGDTHNGFAAQAVQEKQYWLIRDDETGKPIVKMDFSGKVFEFETVESRTAVEDMQLWGGPLMNDYRKHGRVFRKPSETWAMHDELVRANIELRDMVAELVQVQTTFFQAQTEQVHAQTEALKVQLQAKQQRVEHQLPREWLL